MRLKTVLVDRSIFNRLIVGLCGLLLTLCLSFMFGPKRVSVMVNQNVIETLTFKSTVQEVLEELDIGLREEDRINFELTDKVKNNSSIEIDRAREYTIFHDGIRTIVYYPEPEIDSIIANAEIEITKLDIIEASELERTRSIHITRVTEEIVTESARIFFHEQRVANDKMFRGQTNVIQAGNEGIKETSYKVVYHDGKKIEQQVIDEKIVQEKQDRIVEYGTIETISRGGRQLVVRNSMRATATAYCSGQEGTGCPVDHRGWATCTGQYANGYTSIGWRAVAGRGTRENPHIVAVDPRRIPLRSLLYIEGLGFAYAADVGSAIQGNRIDILMPTHQEAWWFGRQAKTVYVIEREL